MTHSTTRRVIAVLAVAVVFGVAMSVLKGNGDGVRSTIGNLSAPWLLVPFLAAAVASGGRISRAVAVGMAASLLALAGFYVANSFVLDLGPHPWPDDLRLAVTGGQRWFELGVLSGPVFGAIGGLWSRSGRLGVAMCSLLIAEPIVELAGRNLTVGDFAFGGTASVAVGLGEAMVGVAACLAAYRLSHRYVA